MGHALGQAVPLIDLVLDPGERRFENRMPDLGDQRRERGDQRQPRPDEGGQLPCHHGQVLESDLPEEMDRPAPIGRLFPLPIVGLGDLHGKDVRLPELLTRGDDAPRIDDPLLSAAAGIQRYVFVNRHDSLNPLFNQRLLLPYYRTDFKDAYFTGRLF